MSIEKLRDMTITAGQSAEDPTAVEGHSLFPIFENDISEENTPWNKKIEKHKANALVDKIDEQIRIINELSNGSPSVVSSPGATMLTPTDGVKRFSNSSIIGAVKIVLPQFFINYTYVSIDLSLMHWSGSTLHLRIKGRFSTSNAWYDCKVISFDDSKPTVRFGHNGSKAIIYVDELNRTWYRPTVFIERVRVGWGSTPPDLWRSGWGIEMESSSFENVNQTITAQ